MLSFAISTPLVFGNPPPPPPPPPLYIRAEKTIMVDRGHNLKKKHTQKNNNRFSISPQRQRARETIYVSVPSTAGALSIR